jgi:hypothetical protein
VGMEAGRCRVLPEFDTAADLARSGDADAARKLLTWYTLGCRTSASFSGARRFLAGLSIPEHLLPAREDRASRPLRAYPAEISPGSVNRVTTEKHVGSLSSRLTAPVDFSAERALNRHPGRRDHHHGQ